MIESDSTALRARFYQIKSDRLLAAPLAPSAIRRLRGFDVFVLAGALINLIVIMLLVGYWLLH